jgi:hypothetical protein
MEKTSNKLVDLSVAFTVEILNLLKILKEQRKTIFSNQIGKAGPRIGVYIHEAQYAYGKADFFQSCQLMSPLKTQKKRQDFSHRQLSFRFFRSVFH